MNNTTKVLIAAAAFVLIFIGAGVYMITQRSSPPISEPTSQESSSSSSMPSVTEDRQLVPGTSSWDEAFAIFSQPSAAEPSKAPMVPDEKIVTENPDGTKNTEIVRPDFSKPEPPPPPKIDESQASDPTKEPEYTPDQIKPNETPETPETPAGGETPNKPNTPETPTGGETNNKGQIYVPGFGWQKPVDNTYEVAENAGTGEVIGY